MLVEEVRVGRTRLVHQGVVLGPRTARATLLTENLHGLMMINCRVLQGRRIELRVFLDEGHVFVAEHWWRLSELGEEGDTFKLKRRE